MNIQRCAVILFCLFCIVAFTACGGDVDGGSGGGNGLGGSGGGGGVTPDPFGVKIDRTSASITLHGAVPTPVPPSDVSWSITVDGSTVYDNTVGGTNWSADTTVGEHSIKFIVNNDVEVESIITLE